MQAMIDGLLRYRLDLMEYLHYVEYAVYGFALLLILISARFIRKIGELRGEGKISRILSFHLQQSLESKKQYLYDLYKDENLHDTLEKVGLPNWFDEVKFQALRDGIFAGWMVLIHIQFLFFDREYPYFSVFSGFLFYLALNTNPKLLPLSPSLSMPIISILKKIEEWRNEKKNRELIMLYNHLLNEYAISAEKPTNLYGIFRQIRSYFPMLQPAIDRSLLTYRKSRKQALEEFAREIGTSQAWELSHILYEVDTLAPQESYQLLIRRYEHFSNLRLENFRRRTKDKGIIGYFLVFVPVLSVVTNFCWPYYLEYKELIQMVNM